MKIVVFLLSLSFFSPILGASDFIWGGIGRVASFGKPFWADMHSTLIRGEVSFATNSLDYNWGEIGSEYRPYIFANLGVDLPLWSGDFLDGKYGFSITLPFMIDTWYDRFEIGTSPIVNTSWWFSIFDFGFIYRLDSPVIILQTGGSSLLPGFLDFNIYNFAIRLSTMKHESTHIGDELTIFRKDEGFPITRIDVLKNVAELVFVLNDPDNQPRRNHGFKLGIIFNYDLNIGLYQIFDEEVPDSSNIGTSNFPFEFYLQYQYQSPIFARGFQMIASAEYRLRQQHNYPYFSSATGNLTNGSADPVNCFNFFYGIRFDNQKRNYFSKIGIGLRYYQGLNPYGQFRSMPNYRQFGVAVFFE